MTLSLFFNTSHLGSFKKFVFFFLTEKVKFKPSAAKSVVFEVAEPKKY